MSKFDQKLERLVKQGHLNLEQTQRMIVKHHMLENHYKKNELVELDIDLVPQALRIVEKIAKKLKISTSAVMSVVISDYYDYKIKGGK